jgi:hypothetical protein
LTKRLITTIGKKTKITTTSIAVIAMLAAVVVGLSSSNMNPVYAKPIDPRFCYTFTSTGGDSGGACFYTMGECKKDEAQFVSEGSGTVEQHCFKNA